ncbi:lanC-like protein GCR2 isoform X2 [Gastrolobium bilobum]|uniref:lanC-like protein GCR2 isoform X2 n=1 Tax=Gastrolobium bilobum TaxID=150636 RepID=UPI002AAFC5BF|nr:lanC-like protein GCR2 isoform X2 [Gastrolobium bilobum]XP_061367261.1 lanC-like protein GCR2 isoform X2 [Gastrolobium bilobum]
MADRFYRNDMPRFVAETTLEEQQQTPTTESLNTLLSLPSQTLSAKFQSAAFHLKQSVVRETWGSSGKRVKDYTLYTGALGTAYLVFKAYLVTKNGNDLKLCSEIVKACDSASAISGRVTFICGRAGVCALGAVIAKHIGDETLLNYYLRQFKEIGLPRDSPYELLYGRAGYLWACSFLNKHIGKDTIPSTNMRSVVDEVITAGRQLAHEGRCPLMYEWHGKKYWGAAHGLAGIMNVLMDMELKPDEVEDVKGTLLYMIKNRFPSGNYPSSEGSESDRLVHWCHGAPGVTLTLAKAAEVFGDKEFLQAATDAGEVVWERGLLKRVGICHGISGNTYVFLSLYRLTGNVEYLYRAKAFSCFLLDRAQKLISEGKMHGGDRPYSLFEGLGGMAYTFLDMVEPQVAKFPGYEL